VPNAGITLLAIVHNGFQLNDLPVFNNFGTFQKTTNVDVQLQMGFLNYGNVNASGGRSLSFQRGGRFYSGNVNIADNITTVFFNGGDYIVDQPCSMTAAVNGSLFAIIETANYYQTVFRLYGSLQAANLQILGGVVRVAGTYNVTNRTVIGAGSVYFGNNSLIANFGELFITGGYVHIYNATSSAFSKRLWIQSGTLDFGVLNVTVPAIVFAGSAYSTNVAIQGRLTTPQLDWLGGLLTGTGELVLTGTTSVATGNMFVTNLTVINMGVLTWNTGNFYFANNARFIQTAGAVMNISHTTVQEFAHAQVNPLSLVAAPVYNTDPFNMEPVLEIQTDATVRVNGTLAGSTLFKMFLDNRGTLEIISGNLALTGGSYCDNGVYRISQASVFEFRDFEHYLDKDCVVTGAYARFGATGYPSTSSNIFVYGSVNVTRVDLEWGTTRFFGYYNVGQTNCLNAITYFTNVSQVISFGVNLLIQGGTTYIDSLSSWTQNPILIQGAGLLDLGDVETDILDLTLAGGTLRHRANITIRRFRWLAGDLRGQYGAVGAIIIPSNGDIICGNSTASNIMNQLESHTIVNYGTFLWLNGNHRWGQGARLINYGLINMTYAGSIAQSPSMYYSDTFTASLINHGTIISSNLVGDNAFVLAIHIDNFGNITVLGGTLQMMFGSDHWPGSFVGAAAIAKMDWGDGDHVLRSGAVMGGGGAQRFNSNLGNIYIHANVIPSALYATRGVTHLFGPVNVNLASFAGGQVNIYNSYQAAFTIVDSVTDAPSVVTFQQGIPSLILGNMTVFKGRLNIYCAILNNQYLPYTQVLFEGTSTVDFGPLNINFIDLKLYGGVTFTTAGQVNLYGNTSLFFGTLTGVGVYNLYDNMDFYSATFDGAVRSAVSRAASRRLKN
jgi:hypothetical protein